MTDTVRVLIMKEAGSFVAQCLEYDIGAQATSLSVLRDRFAAVFAAELAESVARTKTEFGGIAPAPQIYHDMWEKAASEESMTVPADGHGVTVEMAMAA